MCLRSQGIDDDNGDVDGGIWSQVLRNNDGGVGGGREIHDTSEGSETMPEAEGDQRRDRGIYDNDGGVDGGILAQRLQQQQKRRRRRI